jgi:hypothetical protein
LEWIVRNSVLLRLVSAAALALAAGSAMTSPASAFVGLSEKQSDEISEFIKCNTFLLKWDVKSFEGDPDCGGRGPHAIESLTYGENATGHKPHEEECYPDYPTGTFAVKTIRECPVPQ